MNAPSVPSGGPPQVPVPPPGEQPKKDQDQDKSGPKLPNDGKPPSNTNATFSLHIISIAEARSSTSKSTSKPGAPVPNQSPLIKTVLLTSLPVQAPNETHLKSNLTLRNIREQILRSFPGATPFAFCNEDGAVAQDELTLGGYFAGLKRKPAPKETTFNVYVTAIGSEATASSVFLASILKKEFLLKFLRILDGKNSNIEASLPSNVFKDKSPSATALATLRTVVKSMSVDPRQDIFCLSDGTPVQDNVALLQYLIMAKPAINGTDKIPAVPIFLRKTGSMAVKPTEQFASGPGTMLGPNGFRGSGGMGDDRSSWNSSSGGIDPAVSSKLGSPDMALTDRSGQELHRDKTDLQATESLNEKNYAASSSGPAVNAHKLNEDDWDAILNNSNAFRGWVIDFKGNKIRRAPHAVFRLRKGLNLEKVTIKQAATPKVDDARRRRVDSKSGELDESDSDVEIVRKRKPLSPDDIKEYGPRKAQGIPNFSVTDDTNIEVVAIRHEFSHSMAENHFDKTTFEFEAAGVVEGISLGAQAGLTDEKEKAKAESLKLVTKTLVATYKIPRVTVHLSAEDLEVTDEFADAVARIRKSKNIYELRKLHQMFGQIFCSELVVGGCLQTSKTITAEEIKSETVERSKFKASVGFAVGVPQVFNASMKGSHENQDHKEEGTRTFDQREHMSFTATGGNTILAADPPAWLSSVGSDFNSWRVIQQSELKAVVDVVSDIAGYRDVKLWFLQAVPKLTDYIVIPQSRTIDARFKVLFNLPGLTKRSGGHHPQAYKTNRSEDEAIDALRASQTYLAHNPDHPPIFVRTSVMQYDKPPVVTRSPMRSEHGRMFVDVTTKIFQTTETSEHAIFQPPSTQAPVLINPRDLPKAIAPSTRTTVPDTTAPSTTAPPTTTPADTKTTPSSTEPLVDSRTVWSIEVPYGYSLLHDSIVTIKSQARSNPASQLTLTVYRNAQGVLMPSITDHPDPVYWRILKADSGPGHTTNQLKYGDAVRLCWRFSDQTSGWRDYSDDFYGRRRFDRPAELSCKEDSLYLKVPFPRFEGLGDKQGLSLLLSPESSTDPFLQRLNLRGENGKGTVPGSFNLFDLTFRLDYVSHGGKIEAADYMNVAHPDDSFKTVTQLRNEFVTHEPQSASDVANRMVNHVANTYVNQFDNIANAVSSGSPGDVIKETFKGALMINPVGALTKLLGFW